MPKKFVGGTIEEAVGEVAEETAEFIFKAVDLDGADIVAGVNLFDLGDPAALKFWFFALLGLAAFAVALWQFRKAAAVASVPPTVTKKSE